MSNKFFPSVVEEVKTEVVLDRIKEDTTIIIP